MQVPLWGYAFALAALAPFAVRMYANALERRQKRATKKFIEDVLRGAPSDQGPNP